MLAAGDHAFRIRLLGAVGVSTACILYGAALEWLQAVAIPGRTGSWSDVLWNAAGAAGGCLAWLVLRSILALKVKIHSDDRALLP
jgi:VanZ family protein